MWIRRHTGAVRRRSGCHPDPRTCARPSTVPDIDAVSVDVAAHKRVTVGRYWLRVLFLLTSDAAQRRDAWNLDI
jgi:hypothetical protein